MQTGRRTIFFLDEIHRFNKAQQDALLPAVEDGLVTLIGATTENPYFEVNNALLSRAQVYELRPLTSEQVEGLMRTALDAGECGDCSVADDVLPFLAARSGGDARTALNALELACSTAARTGKPVELADAEDALQRKAVLYDKGGDQHYDYISAWIKSTRGSDPDASLYYLAAMLEGGEDPRFIVRRMVILASEDIGNADPQALQVAVAAAAAVEHVGLPEGQYALAQAAIYLSLAPKSNAADARASAPPGPTSATTARSCRPPRCARRPTRRRPSSAAGSATTTRTTTRARSTTRTTCPTGSRTCASTTRATWSRGCASAWSRSAAPAACEHTHTRLDPKFIRARCHGPGHGALRHLPAAAHLPGPGRAARAPAHGRAVRPRPGAPRCSSAAACAADDLDVRRLLAFDPARRHVLCALAPLDGAEVLAGLGAIDFGEDAPDVLVVDERFAPGLGDCSAAC